MSLTYRYTPPKIGPPRTLARIRHTGRRSGLPVNMALTPTCGTVSELRSRLDDHFTLWRTSRYPRAEVGALLMETQQAVRVLVSAERRAASAVLAGVYHLAQKLLAYQPVPELVFLAADRSMTAAQEADDPVAIAGSAWYLAHVFRESGQLDQADRVIQDAAALLKLGLKELLEIKYEFGELEQFPAVSFGDPTDEAASLWLLLRGRVEAIDTLC